MKNKHDEPNLASSTEILNNLLQNPSKSNKSLAKLMLLHNFLGDSQSKQLQLLKQKKTYSILSYLGAIVGIAGVPLTVYAASHGLDHGVVLSLGASAVGFLLCLVSRHMKNKAESSLKALKGVTKDVVLSKDIPSSVEEHSLPSAEEDYQLADLNSELKIMDTAQNVETQADCHTDLFEKSI